LCAAFLAGAVALVITGAALAVTMQHSNTAACTTAYTIGGQSAAAQAGYTTSFQWTKATSGLATGLRTATNGNDTNFGSAGTLCNTQGGNAVTYKIKVFADYIVTAQLSSCSLSITVSVPPSVSVSPTCSGGRAQVKATQTFSCTATQSMNIHLCSSALGGMSFLAPAGGSNQLIGFQRVVSIKLWKSANANPFPFSTRICGRNPFNTTEVCR